ncbi:MAG: 3-deoxy-7-phosphoheptulonate synthase [Actinomycetota bacterium]
MVVVMGTAATEEDIQRVVDHVRVVGGEAFVSRGEHRTIVGLVGDIEAFQDLNLAVLPGVDDVLRVSRPYKLVSRETHPEPSTVMVRDVPIGPDTFTFIAGPCAVENEAQTFAAAEMARAAGANVLRGGAFKPRTSPYAFQGLGEQGLKILAECRERTGLPVVTEVIEARDVELVTRYADMLQIGTRNMQNFMLLKEAGRGHLPVMLKRGLAATIEEWLMAAEYIAQQGNLQVVLCERGIRSFEPATRNTLDLSAVPLVHTMSHLPVIVDPSHAAGRRELVVPLARAAVAVGADGVMIDLHPCPDEALCDGPQALTKDEVDGLSADLGRLAEIVGRRPLTAPPRK